MVNDYLPGERRITLAGDKGYDTRHFVEPCQELNVTPQVAQNLERRGGSAIDGRTVFFTSDVIGGKQRAWGLDARGEIVEKMIPKAPAS